MTDELRVCPICAEWRHRTAFDPGYRSCRWCVATFRARRDHGIRQGLYTADELARITAMSEPHRPWAEGEVWEEKMSPPPSVKELNAPFMEPPPPE